MVNDLFAFLSIKVPLKKVSLRGLLGVPQSSVP